jgi:hypothetical protein
VEKGGVKVHGIDALLQFKIAAFLNRDSLGGLFGLCLIFKNHHSRIGVKTMNSLIIALPQKGFGHFGCMAETQHNEAGNGHIDIGLPANGYLDKFDKLGILANPAGRDLARANCRIGAANGRQGETDGGCRETGPDRPKP